MSKTDVRPIQIAVPLTEEEIAYLDKLKKEGVIKGVWVAEAIREKRITKMRDDLKGKMIAKDYLLVGNTPQPTIIDRLSRDVRKLFGKVFR